ncbi:UDP-N-acetylglucosamine 4,6-dehydratase [Algibacter lectus]|uniref:UDP-N-acetylglucosamine 4,6-dehydratase n=1 Tax=Algibacter lectus TaxID=221126 RepID=A0A090X4E5_9FLAO|nr:UDP-N-acetylglucosamine 4,6-dehydratase [Algibacter lectus]
MIKNYFALYSQKYASKWLVLAIDLAIVMTTFCMAYFIRFNFSLDFNVEQFTLQLPFIFSVSLISFLIVGSFKSVIRHTGFTDVINLFKSVVLIAFIIAVCVLFNNRLQLVSNFTVPKTIIVLHAIISFLFLSASRLVFKMAFKHLKCKLLSTKRILIYGAGGSRNYHL